MPGDGVVFHAEFLGGFLFVFTVSAAHIDNDRYSHLLQSFETVGAGLASAEEIGGDFAEVRQTNGILAAAHLVAGWRTVVLRCLRKGRG